MQAHLDERERERDREMQRERARQHLLENKKDI